MGVAKDLSRAVDLYRAGCDGGDARSCYNLAVAYNTGAGVAIDHAAVIHLMTKICNADQIGCIYRNPTEAGALPDPTCLDGVASACNKLGAEFALGKRVSKDDRRAAELYRKACDQGDGSGCYNLAASYRSGTGVEKDERRAAELQRKACNGGIADACQKR